MMPMLRKLSGRPPADKGGMPLKNRDNPAAAAAVPPSVKREAPSWKVNLRSRVDLSRRATHASILACMAGAPSNFRLQQQSQALSLWGQVYIESFYNGDSVKCAEGNAFYADGAVLVVRDFQRKGYLLLPSLGPSNDRSSGASQISPEQLVLRNGLKQDAFSLLGFAFLAMNTFPFTPAVLGTLLEKAPWLPRKWLLPSQFEQRRLNGLRRARRLRSGMRGAQLKSASSDP
jgi:hypothetical protein